MSLRCWIRPAVLVLWMASAFRADGLPLEFTYAGDVLRSEAGAWEHRGLATLDLLLPFKSTGPGDGMSLFVRAQNGHGEGPSSSAGAYQSLSNLEASDFTQVSEFWVEGEVVPGRMSVRVGKQDGNAVLCQVESGAGFITSSFGLIPNVPLPTFPDPGMGVSVKWRIDPRLELDAGIFDGAPAGGRWGLDGLWDGEGGVAYAAELDLAPFRPFGLNAGALHLAVWHHSGPWPDGVAGAPPRRGRSGLYILVDGMGIGGGKGATERGWFLQLSLSERSRSEIPLYAGAGVVLPLPGDRMSDLSLGLGLAQARFNRDLLPDAMHPAETIVETYIRYAPDGAVVVQPVIQFVNDPAFAQRDAWVLGVRMCLAL